MINPNPNRIERPNAPAPNQAGKPLPLPPLAEYHYSASDTIPPPPPLPTAQPHAPAADRPGPPPRRPARHSGGGWLLLSAAVLLVGVVIALSIGALAILQPRPSVAQVVVPTPTFVVPTPVDVREDYSQPVPDLNAPQQVQLIDGSSIVLEPWDGSSRLNLLMLGLDRRPGETGLSYRTDTIMLVSIDPATDSMAILSIPRDLYVTIPGYNQAHRVNSALLLGELELPGYGPGLAMQTIQSNFGVPLHEYVVADFQAFITLIDALGGIEIDVPYSINDYNFPDMNYGYDPLIIERGPQVMDGYTALRYARTRHSDDDFQRARRQQLVLFAIRDSLLQPDVLPGLIVQAPRLWSSLQAHIYTEMTLDEIIRLGWYLKDIPAENIQTAVLDGSYVADYQTSDGNAVLLPQQGAMTLLLESLFGPTNSR
ncbi:MAG: hypothetical protein GYB67_10505 [Chloroflexi bacterium]|nr:hypothetical protein [Chloroflexota bacterium]